jgi:hypothetical protein
MGRKNLLISVPVFLAATANTTDIGPTIGLNFGADERAESQRQFSLNRAASKANSFL